LNVVILTLFAFSALTLLVGRQEGHPACKNGVVGAGVVICLERGADLQTTATVLPNLKKLGKIGLVDFETIDLMGIVKNK